MAGPKATFDADFGKFISELQRVDVKLKEFEPSVDRSSAKLARMADSLNGNKIVEQAGIAVAAIGKIEGGVEALNNGELRKYGTLIDEATAKLTRQGKEVPPAMAQVKAALDAARQPLDAINKSAGEAGSALSGLAGAIGQGLGIGAGVGAFNLVTSAVSGLKEQLVETLREGNKLSQLSAAFNSLQGGSGPASAALRDLRSATRGLVSDIDLLTAANKASLLGLDQMGIQTDELASVAVRLGKAMGQDAAKSVDDLTTALARQSPQILDNLGIKVDLTAATAKYAAVLGKSTDALTEEERKMAFASAAMEAASAKAALLGDSQLTLSEQVDRVTNALGNMQAGLGAAANESGILAGLVGVVADRLVDLEENTKDAADQFRDANKFAAPFYQGLRDMPELSQGFADGVSLVILPALGALNVEMKAAAAGFKALRTAREFLSGSLNDVTLPGQGRRADIQLGGTFGQGKRAQDVLAAEQKRLTDEYVKAQDDALRKIEQGEQKAGRALDQLAAQRTERLNRLTGRDALLVAQQTVKDLAAVGGVQALSPAQAAKTFAQLFEAREIAKAIAPNLVAGFNGALSQLATSPAVRAEVREASGKIFKVLLDPGELRKVLTTSGAGALLGQELDRALSPLPDAMKPAIADTYELARGLRGLGTPLDTVIERFDKVTAKTADWRTSLRGVSTAFANLSQISGGALDGMTEQIGVIFGAADAATSLVSSLGDLFGSSTFANSQLGRGVAGGLAGFATGSQFGRAYGGGDAAGSFLVGGVGGAAAGFVTGGPVGAGAGFVLGGIGALLAQQEEEEAQLELMRQNREALLAQFDSREDLIAQARRVGFSEHRLNFLLLENTDDAVAYGRAANELTAAFQREQRQAEALAKSLGHVARVNGVLSRQQLQDVRDALWMDGSQPSTSAPGDARVRNPGNLVGGDEGAPVGARGGPRSEAAEAFLRQQSQSLIGGLTRILDAPGTLSKTLVQAVGESLPAALAELERQGVSAIDALRTLEPLIASFRKKAIDAGAGSTPGFDALNAQLALLEDKRLGPLIERANGAGQSLGALQNLGLLTQDTFQAFAASITESTAGLDLLSDRGQNAMRLIRQPLQNVWQLQQDFGYEVDESTQALLDQAAAAGLIGDRFRPTEERMLDGIDRIVERLDQLLSVFTDDLATAGQAGAERTGKLISETFDKVRPRITIDYDYSPIEGVPTTPPAGSPSASASSASGFDAARAATASGQRTGVYIDGRLAGEAILPHLGGILEFHGVPA